MKNNYKKTILFSVTIALQFLTVGSFAQNNENGPNLIPCATVITPEELIEQRQLLQEMRVLKEERRLITPYPIKMVALTFHITTRTDGTGGISLTVVMDQLKRTNSIYRQAGIEFFVCKTLYHNDDALYTITSADATSKYGPLDDKNTGDVWFAGEADGACGWASLPGSVNARVVLGNSCVTNGTTMEHELGHYFGLQHTHAGGELVARPGSGKPTNCTTDGDGFCDTPADPTLSGVSVSSTTCLITSAMGVDANGDTYVPDAQNIMSYSPQKACRTTFSKEQIEYMNYIANNNTSRKSWVCPDANIVKADFFMKAERACGSEIKFYDKSIGTQNFTYSWSFPGGAPNSSTLENPIVKYSSAGTYTVTLSVTTPYGSNQITRSITVRSISPISVPYKEDFSTGQAALTAFDTVSDTQSEVLVAAAGGKTDNGLILTGGKGTIYYAKPTPINAFYTNPAYNSSAGLYCIDFSNFSTAKLSFDYKLLFATAKFNTNFSVTVNDKELKFYTPVAETDEVWKHVDIDLSTYVGTFADIVFKGSSKLTHTAGTTANGVFIDNIEITGTKITTGVNELNNTELVQLFPNPTTGLFTLKFNEKHSGKFKMEIFNTLGARVYEAEGIENIAQSVDLSGIAQGYYSVRVILNDQVITKKIVKQ
ncbi:MAG: T9SS type A sorting domain-containing protein [Bacteroidetes bacterium]|nr:T9SS type A sorting domain-containing protein [Bacteroidota bacterium]